MPSIPVGFYSATMIFNLAGVSKDITWGFDFNYDGSGEPGPADHAEHIYEAFTATGQIYTAAFLPTGWSFRGVSVSFQTEDGPLVGQFIDPIAGTFSGDTVPVNCALLMTKFTASGGRRNKGRAYLPPTYPEEGSIDDAGNIQAASVTAINAQLSDAFDALTDGSIEPVVCHQTAPFTPTPVTSWSVGGLLATQRRRMRK